MNIVCFLFKNWCYPLGTTYVNRLYRMLIRNTTLPFDFYCFTDIKEDIYFDSPINLIRFEPRFKHNLNKLEAFNPKHGFESQTIIIDLDVVLIHNIDGILLYNGPFCVLEGVYHNRIGKPAGSLVSFCPNYNNGIWETFTKNYNYIVNRTNGSERFFYDYYFGSDNNIHFFQRLFPGSILSYKAEFLYKKLRSNTSMIWFHGTPKPHEVCEYDKLIGEHWV